jgi:hypothetical protein
MGVLVILSLMGRYLQCKYLAYRGVQRRTVAYGGVKGRRGGV